MIETTINLSLSGLIIAVFLGLYRLARGPTILDRVLAFDMIATCAVGMTILLSLRWNTDVYLELMLVFSLLGFLTTVAFVFYLFSTVESPGESADATTIEEDRNV